jgi:transcriptional regulator with XRE-family HTH domain
MSAGHPSLRELRKAANLTAAAAAKAAKISVNTLSEIERGRVDNGYRNTANPSMKTVVTLLRLYGKDDFANFLVKTPKLLGQARKARGLSRAELADLDVVTGMTTARAIQAFELSTRVPTLEQLADLLEHFDAVRQASHLRGLVAMSTAHGNTKDVRDTAAYKRRQEARQRREANAKMNAPFSVPAQPEAAPLTPVS